MIHAYLFVTNNNRDRDGHGPEFHKHMYRINNEAGTNISVRQQDKLMVYKFQYWKDRDENFSSEKFITKKNTSCYSERFFPANTRVYLF